MKTCLEMTARWEHTVVPLLYKGRWLGFLLIRKTYRSRRSYFNDYHFINTIQTILTEEVANAVNISRLRNLKDFNETILENISSGVLTTDHEGTVTYMNVRARELIGERAGAALVFDELFSNPFGRGGLFEYLISRAEERSALECALCGKDGDRVTVRLSAKSGEDRRSSWKRGGRDLRRSQRAEGDGGGVAAGGPASIPRGAFRRCRA